MMIDDWLTQTSTSGLPQQVKEMACYLAIAQMTTAQERTVAWSTRDGHTHLMGNVKIISLSAILVGDPGSYKSETVRLIGRVLSAYNKMVLKNMKPDHPPVPIYPHDQVTREHLISTLSQQAHSNPQGPTISCIIVDELINMLNKREYVEPLIGTLNSLLDQPEKYAAGTQKRQTEYIPRPLVSLLGACAPGWFQYMPEALFTGGYAGRCIFYGVPYPRDEDRQPFGRACAPAGEDVLGESLYNIPTEPLVLDSYASKLFMAWDKDYGRQHAHPLPAIDEWYKRRAIQAVRLACCICLSRNEVVVTCDHLEEADKHMRHIEKTLVYVWDQIDSDQLTRYRTIKSRLMGRELTMLELEDSIIEVLKNIRAGHSLLNQWREAGLIVPVQGGKWKFKG